MTQNILKSSLENISFNIVLQILCRGVTFILNAFIVRHVGHAFLGVMNVRLLLLESIIMFLSKEPFAKACLTNTAEHNWAQVVNLLWITVPISCLMSAVFGYIWMYLLSVPEALPQYYNFAVWAIAISCPIELSSLVVQIAASSFLFVRLQVVLDTIHLAIRTTMFVLMIIHHPENALLAFGIAQIAGATFYTLSHYAYFHYYIKHLKSPRMKRRLSIEHKQEEHIVSDFPFKSIKDFLPGKLSNNEFIVDKKLTVLTWSFFRQSILKQILTEGEKLIMTIVPILSFTEQGMYDVVNNVGSLAARFIFRPIENGAYFYFTQMIKRDKPLNDQKVAKIQESVNVLKHLCSVIVSLGLVILIFGQSYSPTLLWIYGGAKLSTFLAITLMRAHCVLVLLLGINGVTECYTNATADSVTINRSNWTMIYESIAFLISSYVFVQWLGPVGFILGNCVNMTLRIFHSTRFIRRRHLDTIYDPLSGLIPKRLFVISLILSAFITTWSQSYFFPDEKLKHLFIGGIMFVIVMACWVYENNELVQLAANRWNERKTSQKKME